MAKIEGRSKIPLPNHTVFLYDVNCDKTDKGDCMMNTIVEEKLISFKELEQKVFKYVCELGCEITRIILESHDKELGEFRDTKKYRGKENVRLA